MAGREAQREIPFIGAEHNDHTDIPHIHSIALIQRRGREMLIDRDTIDALREYATKMALQQKQDLTQEIEFNVLPAVQPAVQKTKENSLTQPPVFIAGGEAKQVFKQTPTRSVKQHPQSCTNCQARQSVVKLKSGIKWCKQCKKVQNESQLNLERDQSFELTL